MTRKNKTPKNQTSPEVLNPPAMPDPILPQAEEPQKKASFPVIGIGASAGGLEAMERLLSRLPVDTGMAFVIISHTDPARTSMLPEILRRKTKIPITEIKEGLKAEPDRAYLPPSDKDLRIEDRIFHLEERQTKNGVHMPIDRFLRSLAEDCEERSGCIILSGTGTDGTRGLDAIKKRTGVTFAQSSDSAQYSGMPQSAIGTGLVDFVLSPEEMPEKLIRYFENREKTQAVGYPDRELQRILHFLANRTRHDFSEYKKSTMVRRVERRMGIAGAVNGSAYLRYLQDNPNETEALFNDLLIGVTSFFRDPEAFAFLKEEMIPSILGKSSEGLPLRVWIPGCSTGEEAYSIAILLQEAMTAANLNRRMQIFATDLDRKAIEKARNGTYPETIEAEVSPERLKRFFNKEDHFYRLKSEIREPIVFAVQNVLSDPPFLNLDLLVCRNLLIYLDTPAQQRLIPLFHYTLNPEGVLFLGLSETVGRFSELFDSIHPKFSIYRKKELSEFVRPALEFPAALSRLKSPGAYAATKKGAGLKGETGIAQAVESLLLRQHTPVCVVTDPDGIILHIHGRTGMYLEHPEGKPSLNIIEAAREGIRFALASALRKAFSSGREIRQEQLRVKTNGSYHQLNLMVKPCFEPAALKDTALIFFEDLGPVDETKPQISEHGNTEDRGNRVIELERELTRLRYEYQESMEALQSSNEELRSANEEILSSNEELQSTNEELESSREELQSLNEEISTVLSELQSRTEELSNAYESIANVLDSTHIAILFLTRQLSILRFTSEAARLFNLIESDIGRPISHITHNLENIDFVNLAHNVLDSFSPFENDILTRDRHWYRMKIMVYRNKKQVIEGIVAFHQYRCSKTGPGGNREKKFP